MSVDIDEPPTLFDVLGNRGPRLGLNPGALAPATSSRYSRVSNPHIPNLDMPETTVLECWLRQHEYVDVKDPHTNTPVRRSKVTWRVVVVAVIAASSLTGKP